MTGAQAWSWQPLPHRRKPPGLRPLLLNPRSKQKPRWKHTPTGGNQAGSLFLVSALCLYFHAETWGALCRGTAGRVRPQEAHPRECAAPSAQQTCGPGERCPLWGKQLGSGQHPRLLLRGQRRPSSRPGHPPRGQEQSQQGLPDLQEGQEDRSSTAMPRYAMRIL